MSKAVIDTINPIELSQRLIRCPSVTPDEGGALDELQNVLEELAFVVGLLFRRVELQMLIISTPGW